MNCLGDNNNAGSGVTFTIDGYSAAELGPDGAVLDRTAGVDGIPGLRRVNLAATTSDWWNCAGQYMKEVTIDNTLNPENLIDYQTLIILNSSNFDFGKAKSNGDDIRFVDSGSSSGGELSYWIEEWDSGVGGGSARVWVKVSLAANSMKTVYMYYGNGNALSKSNETKTFIFFEDFDEGDDTLPDVPVDFSLREFSVRRISHEDL